MADVYDQLLDEQKTTTAPAAPAVPAQSKDAYDTILDGFQAEQDKALQQSLTQAMKVAPQQAATTQQLAKASGLPEDVVERNKDVVQQQVKLREIQSLLAASPILARQMQDPAFAKLAQSDANTLSTIERLWRGTSGGAVEGLGMGTAGIGDVLGIFQRNASELFARTFLPTPIGGWDKVDQASIAGPLLGQDWQTVGNYLKQQGRDIQIPQLQQTFFDQVLAGVGQVGSQVAVGALTGGGGSAAFLYGQGANAMTEKVQGDNASQGAKDLAVLGGAGVTALTEKWALDKLLGPMAVPIQNQVGAALARIGIAGASEGAQETIESISQDAIRQVLTNPDAPIQFGQAFEEGGVGATVGAIVRSVVEAAAGVRGRAMRADQDAAKAERDAQMIEQLNKLAAASELLQTSPETFQQFIEAAAEDGDVQDVYIDAKFLMQSGMADQLAQVSPSVAQQLPTALATGGTVQIPVGEYAAKVAPTEFAQGLLDHIKTDPQGFSRAEAQEYYQNFQQQLEQEIAQQLQAKAGDEEFQASKERVKQTVLNELNSLGRFTPQKNEVDAALIAARTSVRAAQLGMTPEAFFEQQRLRFAAERIDGNTSRQVDVSAQLGKIKAAADRTEFVNSVRDLGNALPDGSTITDTELDITWKVTKQTKNGKEIITFETDGAGANDYQFVKYPSGEWKVIGDVYWPKQLDIKQPSVRVETFDQAAYHGTPHRFDKFSLDAIGTGEGAQVYGWGLYFAGNKEVAEWYRDSLTNARAQMVDNSRLEVGGQVVDKSSEDYEFLLTIERAGGFGPYITDRQMSLLDLQPDHPVYRARVKTIERAKALQEKYGDAQLEYVLDIQMEKADGTLYQVDIPEDNDLLDYSAKFLDQPEKVKQAIAKLFNDIGQFDLLVTNPSGVDIYNFLSEAAAEGRQFEASRTFTDKEEALAFYKEKMAKWRGNEGQMIQPKAEQDFDDNWQVTFGQELDEVFGIQGTMSADRSASLALNKVGIPGLRYQDGMSRGGEGNSYNYVIWDENAVTVEAVNNELAQAEAQAQGEYFQSGLAQTDTPAFKNWFGDSKVVDEQGKPLVVYHGSNKVFDSFKPNERGLVFFTSDPVYASDPHYGGKDGGSVYPVYLNVRNPFDANNPDHVELLRSTKKPLFRKAATGDWRSLSDGEVVQFLKDNGFDGFKAIEPEGQPSIAVFEPTQIKSATGNAGTFDPNNPNILFQGGPTYVTDASQINVDPSEAIVIMGGREFRLPSVMRSQAAPTPRGAFNPNTNTIALLKNADLSTFLHEAGHYFFESDIALAAEIAHGNRMMGADTMTQGEQEILADVGTLFKWLGINGDINEQLAQWYSLSFEEKRAYHEKTAESFERYLFEGKAPSIELQSYFQQFRAWLVNVYKSITDFLTRNPAAGELSDEVRAVFDRMLASTEEIQLAEQARSMMPLFRTQADADNIGMTPKEFRAYQSQDVQATNDAIQDLQARAVRDLQWTRNAHNREVKRLQRLAAELRSEARIDARAEVLSEPVYRAWQFLTRKLQEGDKITPFQRPKSDPNVVDPTIDSLFTAMAKLGGLNKQEAVETWGVEESERPNSGVFGKPVLRATGGKSIDGMVEALAQYGYLPLGTDGKADIADFEQKFDEELRGNPQYSLAYDYGMDQAEQMRPGEGVNLLALGAGRLDLGALADMGFSKEEIELLKARKMTAKDGLHPDLVAELPGIEMSSGDELVRKLLEATPLKEEIDARTDALMLERHGELATPEAIAREADKAIHNEARAKMVATEANALAKATGERKILAKAAKALAQTMIARIKVRDIKPTQYASAEARAAKNAEKAAKSGDLRTAAAEKRSQLVNTYATDAAYKAQDEINAGIRYLRKFENEGSRKGLDVEYLDQIDSLLERFDLRKGQSLKTIDKRETLAKWIAAQEDQGIEPDIPQYILAEANRVHYKNLTVEEFRGLVDSVKQIEHLGRLKKKLLTAKDQRELDAIVDEISTRIEQSSGGRVVDNEVRNIMQDKLRTGFNQFLLAHRKAASLARELDGFEDGGPVWEYFIRPMNEAGDYEVTKRAEVSAKLHELSKPIVAGEEMGGKGRWFPSLGRNLNRGERLAIALNWGNDSNRQRLLGGRGWTAAQVQPVLGTLTAQEWQFVQGVWDLFESFRPEIGAKEKRVSGKEPDWIEATPLNITTADGQQLQLRGGYYPVKYDPRQSGKAGEHSEAEQAKQMLRAAYTAATTRRSFTKSRAAEVHDRPLLLSFDGIQQGLNEVIHDLAWHEWLIDANKLLRRLDKPIRTNYGADFVDMLKKSVKDIATGDTPAANAIEKYLSHARNGATIVGMGWNLTTALLQPLGFTQTAVRIGPKWMGRGISAFFGSPSHMIAKAEEVNSKSKLMANRALTLNREINDVLNRLETSKSETYQRIESTFFIMIQKMQAMVDYPTWLGAYDKALADPANSEERAIALADQAVLDAQGGGQTKDLALVQRGSPLLKLFTNFYSYFNVLYNLTTEQTKKRVKAKEYGGLLTDYTMLMIVPAVMSAVLRNVLKGEDDEDKYAKDILSELVGMPFGMFLVLREMADAVKLAAGVGNPGLGYSGPAGLRFFNEVYKLGQQAGQGEWDMAFFKAANNVAGILFHYPAGQVNRAVEGAAALIDGKTDNPLAPLVGVQK